MPHLNAGHQIYMKSTSSIFQEHAIVQQLTLENKIKIIQEC